MYDFQAAVNAAKEAVERAEKSSGGSNKDYTYPLVYPQAGHKITIRPLFNPKSGQIVRLVQRHEKVACYRTYGIECPICKSMQEVKNMTGQDPFGRSKASKSRGICFAQYISSSNEIDKGNNKGKLQPGEVILFMFPWSVYTQISATIQTISQTPTGMDQAFCHSNTGMFLDVSVTGDFKYTVTVNPYLSFNNGKTDEEFMKMLDEMESLYEQVLPSTITEEVNKQVNEYNAEIYKQYIQPRVATVLQNSAPQNFNQQIPQQPQGYVNNPSQQFSGQVSQQFSSTGPGQQQYVPTRNMDVIQNTAPSQQINNFPPPVSQQPSGQQTYQVPACFGTHKENFPECILCPCEAECIQKTVTTVPL